MPKWAKVAMSAYSKLLDLRSIGCVLFSLCTLKVFSTPFTYSFLLLFYLQAKDIDITMKKEEVLDSLKVACLLFGCCYSYIYGTGGAPLQ